MRHRFTLLAKLGILESTNEEGNYDIQRIDDPETFRTENNLDFTPPKLESDEEAKKEFSGITHGTLVSLDKKDEAEELWQKLGDVPTNEDEEIDEDFLHFPKGTDRFDIWHWFEEEFNLSVAEDLMGLK